MAAPGICAGSAQDTHDFKVLRPPTQSMLYSGAAGSRSQPMTTTEFNAKYSTRDLLVQGEVPVPFRPTRRPIPEYFTNLSDPTNPTNRSQAKAITNNGDVKRDLDRAGSRTCTNTLGMGTQAPSRRQLRGCPASPKPSAAQNPITWEGAPQERRQVRTATEPSKELQKLNARNAFLPAESRQVEKQPRQAPDTRRVLFPEDTPAAPAMRKGRPTSGGAASIDLEWRGGGDGRGSANQRDVPQLRQSAEGAKQRQGHGVVAASEQVERVGDSAKAKVREERGARNQREFDKLAQGATVSVANQKMYGNIFRARDRNTTGIEGVGPDPRALA